MNTFENINFYFLKNTFLIGILCTLSTASSGTISETQSNLHFSAKIDTDKSNQNDSLIFSPPVNHHFNLEAPSKVRIDKESLSLTKSFQAIRAISNRKLTDCKISAELYLCNEQNTYCVPVKEEFTCALLTRANLDLVPAENKSAHINDTTKGVDLSFAKANQSKLKAPADIFIINNEDSAFAEAQRDNKPVLIDFFGIWCPPCNILDESVFISSEFIKLRKDFVYLKLDADNPISFNLKSKFNIKGYPTVVIANKNKELITVISNLNTKAFLSQMRATLNFKNQTISERIKLAESSTKPDLALNLALLYLNSEDFANAHYFSYLAMTKAPLTIKQRMIYNKIQLAILKDLSKDESELRKLSFYYLNVINKNKPGIENFELTSELMQISEDIKDESLKTKVQLLQKESIEYLLDNKAKTKASDISDISEADLLVSLASLFEDFKDSINAKKYYAKAASSYEKEINRLGLDLDSERGNNLERAYCLNKSGQSEKALSIYQRLEELYPNEFTFYFSHANALKENKQNDLALEKALVALKYSYGDNQLRAAHLVADLQNILGQKTEALLLINKTLSEFPELGLLKVRSKRYLTKLAILKAKIEKPK